MAGMLKPIVAGVNSHMFVGGWHWYAHAWWYWHPDETWEQARREEAKHNLTVSEAAALNRHYYRGPESRHLYKRGDESVQFETEEAAIDAAEAILRDYFGPDVEIVRGRFRDHAPTPENGRVRDSAA